MGPFEIVIMILIAVAQLALGIACGWWLKERRTTDTEQLQPMLARLTDLAQNVTDDVDDHSSAMNDLTRELNTLDSGADLNMCVLAVVERIASANTKLQTKLADAKQQMREQAERLDIHITEARIDVTTELANRRAFNDELGRRYAELQRTGNPFSLLVADIDHFKRINDQFGHDAGDVVLKRVAQALRTTVRDMDLVARYGGEEFAILLPMTALDRAARAAERAREAVEQLTLDGELAGTRVTISIGYSQAVPNDNSRELFGRADLALYAAKEAGRNCCRSDIAETAVSSAVDARQSADLVNAASDTNDSEKRIDVLTGLPNRRQLVDELKSAFSAARAKNSDLALMLMAVDHMEKLTAAHDQVQIDQLLLRIAATLTAEVRQADSVLRYGWEEFAVLMPKVNAKQALAMNLQLRERLEAELPEVGTDLLPTFSCGVALLRAEDDPISFASRAEMELEKARTLGGGRIYINGVEHQEPVAVG
ncbi:MAG: GGDEF domain-containing protein [Planctomycetes bacterium]|nr:GGDEF domain-containing protein [Planctomycetota bacterium]